MSEEKRKRGRPRKVIVTDNTKILSDDAGSVLLMEEKNKVQTTNTATHSHITIEDVKNSLTSLYSDMMGANGKSNVFTNLSQLNEFNPFLQNSRLKMINTYPSTHTPEDISKALADPQNNELMLQSSAAGLSSAQYLYYKILREACDIPLFKHYVIPESLDESEYLDKDFVNEEEFVNQWIDTLHIPATFKKISMEVKREGKPSYLFRQCLEEKSGKKRASYVTFQKLPAAFTKLTGIGQYGYIASFNMLIFLQPAFSPLQYPKYIQDIWNDLTSNGVINKDPKTLELKPDLDKLKKYSYKNEFGETISGTLEIESEIDNVAKKAYMYWVQLPQDLCFTFASDMSNAWAAPDTMGLFTALQELTDYSTLAGLIVSSPLTAVLTGQVEFCEGAQPGQDQTKVSPHTLEAFTNLFNEMVSSNINAYFGPFKDLRLQSLPNVPNSSDIKTKAVQNFITAAGEGGLISSTDKPSVAAIKGAQLAAESQYDFVTRQIEDAVNAVLKRHCDLSYDWKIKFWGGIYTFDSQVKTIKEMVQGGATFLMPKLASAYDLNMRDVRGISNYISANKIYDKFKTLGWAQTQQNQVDNTTGQTAQIGAGRKTIDDEDIENDNTAQSKESGANISELKGDYSQHNEHICPLCGEPLEDDEIICSDCIEEYGLELNNNKED